MLEQRQEIYTIQHPPPDFGNLEGTEELGRRRMRRGQSHRNENENEMYEGKVFMCMQPGCSRIFTSKFKLDRHVLIHTGVRKYVCSKCGKRFHRKDHLKNHFGVHNANKPKHLCELCPKAYVSLLSFRKHIAYHAAQNGDLVCKICGKSNDDREGILQHLKMHSTSRTLRGPSERKYPCDRCERSFFTKKDVKRHLVVHTGKRDFVCEFCPQRFGRKDHLVRHKKKSHCVDRNSPPENSSSYANQQQQQQQQQRMVNDNLKTETLMSSSLSDMTRLQLTPPPVQQLLDVPMVEVCKPEAYAPPPTPSNLVQPAFTVGHIPGDGAQNVSRFVDSTLLPVSQYVPMNSTYPGVSPIMSHHYLNVSSSNMLPDLLPPMSVSSPFPGSVSLDLGNPPLPHFSQAFHSNENLPHAQ